MTCSKMAVFIILQIFLFQKGTEIKDSTQSKKLPKNTLQNCAKKWGGGTDVGTLKKHQQKVW